MRASCQLDVILTEGQFLLLFTLLEKVHHFESSANIYSRILSLKHCQSDAAEQGQENSSARVETWEGKFFVPASLTLVIAEHREWRDLVRSVTVEGQIKFWGISRGQENWSQQLLWEPSLSASIAYHLTQTLVWLEATRSPPTVHWTPGQNKTCYETLKLQISWSSTALASWALVSFSQLISNRTQDITQNQLTH